ncbi:MAG TPA: putative lipid II flippase FtsW [Methylomirabilota bacterium]|jgi:cell division protein FtsW|nr:putative lipid II flippase FtsW [Methylomirabilota bacterium]
MPRRLVPDLWLFGVAVVLLSAGVVMVYSASTIVAADRFHDPYFFLKKQLFWALIGAGAMWVALRVDYRWLERAVVPALIVAGVLLVLVLVPPIGQAINGTRRWIRLGPVSFQPAELAKLALVVYLAAFLARKRGDMDRFRTGTLPPLLVAGAMAALVLVQPDLGNCLTLIALTFGLLYLAGSPIKHLAWVAAPAVPLIALAVWMAPYRMRRITAFIDPWADPRGSGFQIIQSWLALGNGGLLGQGIGGSRQKLFYLPESHTDFIFAILGEELGFVGGLAIVALFAVLIWRGLRVGLRAPDAFGAYLALGITVLLATQTLVNLGVVTGLLPTKGLPLPFISFGGSALLMTMLATGVLLNISQHAHV